MLRPAVRLARDRARQARWWARVAREDRSEWDARALTFVIGQPRTGTTLLRSYLNQADGWDIAGEVLNPSELPALGASPAHARTILDDELRRRRAPMTGAKLMIGHLERFRLPPAELAKRYPAARFVVIHRESILDQFVSLKVAEQTRQWQSGAAAAVDPLSVVVRTSAAELRSYAAGQAEHYRRVARGLPPRRTAWVRYEDLATDPGRHLRTRAGALLARDFRDLGPPETRRQRSRPPEEVVADFASVVPDPDAPWLRLDPPGVVGPAS